MSVIESKKSSISISLDNKESKAALLNSLEKNLSSNFSVCRICHANNVPGENLISPCRCKGSLAYVHLSCLETWINESFRLTCELCGFRYRSIQTRRYTICESLKVWLLHPRNKVHMQADVVIAFLLTLVTIGLATVCFIGMEYFIIEGNQAGVSKKWIKASIYMFLALVIAGYVSSIYLLFKNQFVPWYNWWKATVDVRLAQTSSNTRQNIEFVT
ncbi:E3 ubiquitin-protein ligase MARCHF3-like isoform X1 [Tribolium madens]|uniref:E3 ubiquitin-protein ligase MARCHF3-like isoform X1 n=2 Tax=Tribolium madens TaxID=41895 RepID=UPI001CF72730|nr:E3 ubiquitin-protein ligase MARCHF3-like isoform X1 [Tribolium madens]